MRLYSRTGATALSHEGVTYTPAEDGGFEMPEHVGTVVHRFHVDGIRQWETFVERQQRLVAEDRARRADPTSQYDVLERIMRAAEGPAPDPAAAQIEALLKRVAELEAAQGAAEPEGDGEEDEDEDDQDAEPEAKPAVKRTRKTAQAGG